MIFSKKPQVAHIRLSGVIGNVGRFQQGMSLSSHEQIIKKAFSQKKLSAVAISINSPGGSPVQSHLIYSLIRRLAEEKKVKVITFAEDVAASGGYMLACAGDEIYANPSSIVGSIGVIYSSFGLKELIKKIGIERRVHTAGKNKSTLDPFMDEKPEDIERLKKIQLDLHDQFISLVKNSRKNKISTDKDDILFTGEFWSGIQSKELGLVDGLGNMEEIIQEKFGKKVVIKKFDKPESWLKRKLSSQISNQFSNIADEIETRSLWNKFGL
jgi:signal peptide peptidase SppA